MNVVHLSVNPSNREDDTPYFEEAIHLVKSMGGGRLIVGPGLYHIRPINLTSHLELVLRDAVLTAIPHDWPIIPPLPSYGQGRDHPGPRYSSLIHGDRLENVTIVGSNATIDGFGEPWWKNHTAQLETITRGSLIEFLYSTDVRIYNVQLKNSPFWTVHMFDCENVHIRDCHIKAPLDAPNTDGWDPDSSRNVSIEDSSYRGGDDCVSIKSGWDCFGVAYNTPCWNITLRNLTCYGNGGIALGSEISGGIQGVLVQDVSFPEIVNRPVCVKVGRSRGGYIRDAVFRNLTVMHDVEDAAIFMDSIKYSTPSSQNPSCPPDWMPPSLSVVDNISITQMNGQSANFFGGEVFRFVGLSDMPITNIYLEDIHFHPRFNIGWNCSAVRGRVKNGTVTPWPPCGGFTIVRRAPMEVSRQARKLPVLITWTDQILSLPTIVFWLALCTFVRLSLSYWKSLLSRDAK